MQQKWHVWLLRKTRLKKKKEFLNWKIKEKYRSTRHDNHGRSHHIILVQVTSHIQITILRIAVSKQPSLPR